MAEARKYKLSLFLAHQYLGQLNEDLQKAIFGNVGTVISFRVGAEDAERLAKEFAPVFDAVDFSNLPRYSMYLKLMIDGVSSRPFSAVAMALKTQREGYRQEVVASSRIRYGKKEVKKEVNVGLKKIENDDSNQPRLF